MDNAGIYFTFAGKSTCMEILEKYSDIFQDYLEQHSLDREPNDLYEPIRYILSLGGKKVRPVLALMICDALGTDFKKAIPAALAIEYFHNFSLIHDDIMDNAPIRRGKQTVHEKWDVNTGILSGDAMLILAYQFFETYEPKVFLGLAKLFSKTAIQVCEGQQYDMDFETRDEEVGIDDYLHMIDYKTAVLLGAAMQMGAMVANASESNQESAYDFGRNLGIAFQLQDDYLDAFGNSLTFGKQIGGDIIANKKTILYIKAMELGTQSEKEELEHLFSIYPSDPYDKISTIKELFVATGAVDATRLEIKKYSLQADKSLTLLEIASEKKSLLQNFAKELMERKV